MDSPHLDAVGERELLASGASGAVFRAVKSDGSVVAVKLLDGMAVNRALLEKACARLEGGPWPKGVIKLIEADYAARPAAQVTPCHADRDESGHWRSRTLQQRLADFPGEDSWRVILGLIDALAALHEHRVAHGNLKPGNVFFDDDDEVLVVDWALGNMPGVALHEFSDACLYQPPEQLRAPEGYFEEAGYRWDVFALGVLAYRLLTGSFPRCDATFREVAPQPGEISREGIAADLPKIAEALEARAAVSWPAEPGNELEARYREILESCLSLDPHERPANALEVRGRIRAAERAVEEEAKREALLNRCRRAQRSAWRASLVAGLAFAGLGAMAFLWHEANTKYEREVAERQADVAGLSARLDEAEFGRREAREAETAAEEALSAGESTWLARLEASRSIGDRLFEWLVRQGRGEVPPLDEREARIGHLEDYYRGFLERTAGIGELANVRARARLQLAELALVKGEPDQAAERLEAALESAGDLEAGPGLDLRLATDRLVLALLFQERADPATGAAFETARRAIGELPRSQLDGDRVDYLAATLDLNESRLRERDGRESEALEMLHRATETLNRLTDHRPDSAILRSELAGCYLSSAGILDSIGELGDARSLREMAAEILRELVKERPESVKFRLELAGCYGGIAEKAMLAGDIDKAEEMSRAATNILTEILPRRPDSVVARSRLAAQRGLLAGIARDRGEAEKAMELYDEGLRLLEDLIVGPEADPLARYRGALLMWERAKMIGFDGDREAEIGQHERAAGLLEDLLDTPYGAGRSEQIRRALGYVLGDLGHAAQLADRPERSRTAFERAAEVWGDLNRERPENEEYAEALAWNLQRLEAVR
jgi:tetratricopeptide (TPR) repeat protein